MDQHDKVYLWLVIVTFLSLAGAMGFAWAEITELRDTQGIQNPFQQSP